MTRRYKKGDVTGAYEASNTARKYSTLSIVIVLAILVAAVVLLLSAVLFGTFYGIDTLRGLQVLHNIYN